MIAALRALGLTAAALALSACVSLLPDAEPSQLYRLEAAIDPGATVAPPAPTFGLVLPTTGFVRAASGDRILTVTGDEVAYIAGARWVAPATDLFGEAVERAFDANTGPARLVTRGEMRTAESVLRLDVRRFEVVYDRGQNAAPLVVVRLRATLVNRGDRALIDEDVFEAEVRATDNRVSAIVAAFNSGTGQVLTQLVDWSNRTGAPRG
ncbi:MAG: ABC-type transport auxiliary lipoprotein family protein [Phenylobacterium sp.]|uniref:ABC-type transport auxiliary lipoprotein family protein n=1 Tax=Phenylobacterium sp. TaxID=1871053 RepID=UPI002729249C|nr:ABC-type transport auxiliary lipoprotein family protein [Phenylobacterium sp.]MDO8411815.1 ABC-type transport auxiliary lipoprotein family protein [Phenylobacterium sp.]